MSAPNASSCSAELARQASTRSPRARAASMANVQRVVLPMPASPSTMSATGRGPARERSIEARSPSRPMIEAVWPSMHFPRADDSQRSFGPTDFRWFHGCPGPEAGPTVASIGRRHEENDVARWLQKVVLIGGIALVGATGYGCSSAATPGPASSPAQPYGGCLGRRSRLERRPGDIGRESVRWRGQSIVRGR